jgi:hypothetical protein
MIFQSKPNLIHQTTFELTMMPFSMFFVVSSFVGRIFYSVDARLEYLPGDFLLILYHYVDFPMVSNFRI